MVLPHSIYKIQVSRSQRKSRTLSAKGSPEGFQLQELTLKESQSWLRVGGPLFMFILYTCSPGDEVPDNGGESGGAGLSFIRGFG